MENAQPLVAETSNDQVAIAHNGQFANCRRLKREFQEEVCIINTESDTEIILHKFARSKEKDISCIISASFACVKPAYSALLLTRKLQLETRIEFLYRR